MPPPQEIAGLIKGLLTIGFSNEGLIRALFLGGGGLGGGTLGSHDTTWKVDGYSHSHVFIGLSWPLTTSHATELGSCNLRVRVPPKFSTIGQVTQMPHPMTNAKEGSQYPFCRVPSETWKKNTGKKLACKKNGCYPP